MIEEIKEENLKKEKILKEKNDESDKKLIEFSKEIRDKKMIIKSMETMREEKDNNVLTMKEKVRIAEETLTKNNIIKVKNFFCSLLYNYNKSINE